jgi:CDP-diacylglycerol---glycerol-3-phosphate 3-phosphatidyltransferase
MTPNQITTARVAAAFAAVALFTFCGRLLAADLTAVVLTIVAIALDGLDGYIARTRGLSTSLGAQLDIMGDRIVENLFFTLFAVRGLVSIWIPVLFFVRGTLTDFVRGLAIQAGRIGLGREGMHESGWARGLAASRASRASYAILKCVCFCYLGLLLPLRQISSTWLGASLRAWVARGGHALAIAAAVFCLVRAIPVLWDGRRYLGGLRKPVRGAVWELGR